MANTAQRPTARGIAEQCGVSVATVSRVLNSKFNHGFSVRKELHDQITQMAEELGYRPNLAARNLSQQKTNIVAFLGYHTSFGWPSNIYQPACESSILVLQGHGYDVCTVAPRLACSSAELPPWRIDGAIVLQECSSDTIDEMDRMGLPYVVINGAGGRKCTNVIPDDFEGTRIAVKHLIDLGHQRIAYAGPSSEHHKHPSISLRHETYLLELKKNGLEPVEGHGEVFTSGLDFLFSAVVKQNATAIIAYDHFVAIKILHFANVLNIQIPRQVSLICFNNENICEHVVPPLTTVGIPSKQMGQIAAERLLEMMETSEEEHMPECVKLSEELVVRSSTVKVPVLEV